METLTERQTAPRRNIPGFVWIAFVGASLLYGPPSVWLLMSYMQPAYDLGIYDQSLWLLANGESFITIAAIEVNSAHFSPILYLLSPISHIPGGAIPELVVQSLLIASGVFPAWLLGRQLGQDPRWFVLVYAIHPAIVGGSWFGWRPWNIAVPVFMWVTWWITERATWQRIALAGIVMLVFREDLAVWVGIVALVLFLAKRIRWRTLIIGGLLLGASTALVLLVILPAASAVDGYYFTSESQVAGELSSPAALASSAVARLVFLLAPLALLPRRYKWLLLVPLAIPVAGLLVRGGNSLTTFFHYDMMFVPPLLLVAGLSTQLEYNPKALGVASLLTIVLLGALRPFPPQGGGNPWRYDSEIVAEFDVIREAIKGVSGYESISMTLPGAMVAHYSERSNIFIYPFPVDVWRDSTGEEGTFSYRFDCPPPNLVSLKHESLSPAWTAVLADGYSAQDSISGAYGLWLSAVMHPNKPCSADLVLTR